MDGLLAAITFSSLVLTAGFCDGGNYAAAAVSVTILGVASEIIKRRYERGKEREPREVARQYDRSA